MGFGELHDWCRVELSNTTGTEAFALGTCPDLALGTSSCGCSSILSYILYYKPVNLSVSLHFVSYFSKLSNIRRGSLEPLIYSWFVQRTGDNLVLAISI